MLHHMQAQRAKTKGRTLRSQYIALGRKEGKIEGRTEGKVEGRTEGRAEALRASILDFLEARFGEIPYALREAILAIDSPDALAPLPRVAAKADSLEAFRRSLP